MRTQTRPAMTAEQARDFAGVSIASALQVEAAIAERTLQGKHTDCKCSAYADVFTFNRWKAQGFSVCKGESSLRIGSYASVTRTITTEDGQEIQKDGLRPVTLHLFCRCQVRPSKG